MAELKHLEIKKLKIMKKGTRNALLGFVAGAAAGTLTGILFAPDKGSKTRKDISKKVKNTSKDISETLSEKVDKLKDQVNEIIKEMRGKAKEAEEKVKEKVEEKVSAGKGKSGSATI
jgi:gas vesicle protein